MLCLFDLDGTLIDSEQGITACVKHALVRMDVPPPDDDALRGWIGPPLRLSLAPLLDHDGARIETAVEHYHQRFHTDGWREYEIYPGIETLIERLLDARHTLAIVTSKPHRHAAPIIARLPFGKAFVRLYGPDPASPHSEKAAMIAAALDDFHVAPEDAVMIGDRRFDIEGAVANRVRGIGVLWGFGSRAELEQAGANAIATTPDELQRLLLD